MVRKPAKNGAGYHEPPYTWSPLTRCDQGFLPLQQPRAASIFKMMDQSGHKSIDTLRGYVRDAELFKDHAGAGLL
jgi:hypothetical protein